MKADKTTPNSLQIINAFKTNDTLVLKQIYSVNYLKIELFVIKNSGTKEHAKDIFQEAFLAVWQNIKQNTYKPQNNASVNSYLYAIAKNKWIDKLRSKEFKNTIVASSIQNFEIKDNTTETFDDDILKNQRLKDVMNAFKDLGDACKNLLRKFYFEKKSMTVIAKELKLDTASTRNKKYRCMQKLRQFTLKDK